MHNVKELKKLTENLAVLVVDDEEEARVQLKGILNILFLKVYSAKNGTEALDIYNSNHIDLVITDLTMPKMNGFMLVEKIKEQNISQQIIVMSAHAESDATMKAIKIGVDGYILKPVEANQMLEAIKKTVYTLQNEKAILSYQNDLEKKVNLQTKEIIQQMECDTLTGLYNKEKLNLDFLLQRFSILMMIDIDNFSHINGAYGDYYGDLLLIEVGKFLGNTSNQKIYKGYSDEYFLALNLSKDEALTLANEIKINIYDKLFNIEITSVRITFTIGLVEITEKDEQVPYSKAHHAITDMRKLHKNIVGFYQTDSKVQNYHKNMYEWANKTKEALEKDFLVPYYQPIVNVKTGKFEKYECLARIEESKDKPPISPFFFIEPSRVAGMVTSVTRRIIKKSFENFSNSDIEFSINITDDDLKENYLSDYLQGMAAFYKIKHHQVVLEVLENISDFDAKYAIKQIDELKALGFQIAIDDFGAESSNFSRLQSLNTDYIKIDGAFVKDIATNENSLIIVKTIIYYAKHRGIKLIAEFVHNEETYNVIKKLGVDYIQGYYFSEPKREV